MNWTKALGRLQDDMATIDLFTQQSGASAIEFLIKEHQAIKLRMDANRNHKRPHVHIDYGKQHHIASYAIDSGERLAGNLHNKYDKQVQVWIATHRDQFLQAWEIAQSGQKPEMLIAELKGSAFGELRP